MIYFLIAVLFGVSEAAISRKVDAGVVEFKQQSTPSNPSAGFNRMYSKVDGLPYWLNSAGVEQQFAVGAAGISQLTGDVTAGPGSGSQAATIATNAVSDSKFRQSAGLSVVGRSANSTGSVADITAASDGEVLRRSGTSVGFGTVATSGIGDDQVTNAKMDNMAQSTIKGRAVSAGTGDPTDLTATQATAILDVMVGDSGAGGTKGLVPAPASGDAAANKYLKANGQWETVSASGFSNSYQYWDGAGSYGSTNTKVPQIANQRANVGSDISCSNSSANGFSCTINTTGLYEIALCMRVDAAVNTGAGITLNGSALTTNIQSVDYSQGMRGMCYIGASNGENTCCVTRTMPITATDVVRPQGDGTAWNNTQRTNMSITRVK